MVTFMFYLCAALAVTGALGVIGCRNPMHSALSMIGTMLSLAVIYLLHKAEFIAAIQIGVYAGAVMMLIIYVIFLLDIRKESSHRAQLRSTKLIGVGAGALVFLIMLLPVAGELTGAKGEMTEAKLMSEGSVQFLAEKLFTQYLLPFEVASLVLLVGLIGAIALAKKKL